MSKLYFRYGAMNSGKSTLLLQTAHNYRELGHDILIVKPGVDSKGGSQIVSRLGVIAQPDFILPPDQKLLDHIKIENLSAILVDEAQFMTREQVDELYAITKFCNIPVLCYGLRCDFNMNGFPGATRLLEIADEISELKTICACGAKATQNIRRVNGVPVFEGEQICIDNQATVSYDAVCGRCHLNLRQQYSAHPDPDLPCQ
jgi:thymidine kinase